MTVDQSSLVLTKNCRTYTVSRGLLFVNRSGFVEVTVPTLQDEIAHDRLKIKKKDRSSIQ